MLDRRSISVDGISLSYLERGQRVPGTPSLVLLHGLMGCAETYAPMMRALPEDLHVIALDLPGSGGSERRKAFEPRMAVLAEVVGDFLRILELGAVCLCGHSHGGAVAMQIAQTWPELVKSLVLVSPAHPYFDEGDPLIRFYLSLPGRIVAYTMPWYPKWLQMAGLRRMAGPKSWDTPERLMPYRTNLQTPGTIAHLLELLRTWHEDMAGLRRLLRRKVKVPALVIWGDCDRAVPMSSSLRLLDHMQSHALRCLQGVGHRPAEERAEMVAELVAGWMRGTIAPDDVQSVSAPVRKARGAVAVTARFHAGD